MSVFSSYSVVKREEKCGFARAVEGCIVVYRVIAHSHNLKVVGSNPTPATNKTHHIKDFATAPFGELFALLSRCSEA